MKSETKKTCLEIESISDQLLVFLRVFCGEEGKLNYGCFFSHEREFSYPPIAANGVRRTLLAGFGGEREDMSLLRSHDIALEIQNMVTSP